MMKSKIYSLEEYIENLPKGSYKKIMYGILKDSLDEFGLEVTYFETRDVFLIYETFNCDDSESVKVYCSLVNYFKLRIENVLSRNERGDFTELCENLKTLIDIYYDKYDE